MGDGPPLQELADPALLEECNLRPTSLLQYLLTDVMLLHRMKVTKGGAKLPHFPILSN